MNAPYYNGGPDEREPLRGEGSRREERPVAYPIGQPCAACERPIHRVYTLAGVGAFCSPGCRERGPRQVKQGAA